jgi:hypothetical protein
MLVMNIMYLLVQFITIQVQQYTLVSMSKKIWIFGKRIQLFYVCCRDEYNGETNDFFSCSWDKDFPISGGSRKLVEGWRFVEGTTITIKKRFSKRIRGASLFVSTEKKLKKKFTRGWRSPDRLPLDPPLFPIERELTLKNGNKLCFIVGLSRFLQN